MVFLQELAMEIWICVFCINLGIAVVAGLYPAVPIKSPFSTNQNVTALNSNIAGNFTGTTNLVTNMTTSVKNATSSSLPWYQHILNPIQDFVFYPLNVLWTFVQFLTGGFIFQVLAIFGMPNVFVYGLQTIIGVLFARTLMYYLTGR